MILSFAVARISSICFCSCSAMTELGVVFDFRLLPNFRSSMLWGHRLWNTLHGSQPSFVVCCVVIHYCDLDIFVPH